MGSPDPSVRERSYSGRWDTQCECRWVPRLLPYVPGDETLASSNDRGSGAALQRTCQNVNTAREERSWCGKRVEKRMGDGEGCQEVRNTGTRSHGWLKMVDLRTNFCLGWASGALLRGRNWFLSANACKPVSAPVEDS